MADLTKIKDFFRREKIEYYSAVPLSECKVIKPYLLGRSAISADTGSALVFLAPYYTGDYGGNVSLYAVPRDYHIYFSRLFGELCALLTSFFPDCAFHGFADHSPVDEVHAASKAGLGAIGDNGLLINDKYSSFVFIGAICSNLGASEYGDIAQVSEIAECLRCGKCAAVCPSRALGRGNKNATCLSAVTQKKGALTADEVALIRRHGSVWGCDLCQTQCPMVKPAVTEIEFFHRNIIANLDSRTLAEMSDAEFAQRAYSWRGRETIARNLQITGDDIK